MEREKVVGPGGAYVPGEGGGQNMDNEYVVVAMGAGTAHRPSAEVAHRPAQALNDCHAEILSRRAFVKHLLNELEKLRAAEKASGGDAGGNGAADSIFVRSTNGRSCFMLKPGIRFHLYISVAPCGDASCCLGRKGQDSRPLIPVLSMGGSGPALPQQSVRLTLKPSTLNPKPETLKQAVRLTLNPQPETLKQAVRLTLPDHSFPYKKSVSPRKTLTDTYVAQDLESHWPSQMRSAHGKLRAKLDSGESLSKLSDDNGPRFCKMSCSDKILRWNVCGLQVLSPPPFSLLPRSPPLSLSSYLSLFLAFSLSGFLARFLSRSLAATIFLSLSRSRSFSPPTHSVARSLAGSTGPGG